MRSHTIALGLIAGIISPSLGAEVIVPEFLATSAISETPFKYNGLLISDGAIGSSSFVAEGVIATAAHVIFDEEALAWVPINDILYYPEYHQTTPFNPSGTFYPLVAFVRWETSYKTRVEEDDQGAGFSSIDTFNLDFAVGYMNKFLNSELVEEFPEVHVDAEEVPSILRQDREKMIVGYPADTDFISSSHRGLMHRTLPGNYFCFWSGLEDLTASWRDSENYWVATYEFEGVTTYPGNSGGPIYARDDTGNWTVAGIVVGSVGSEGVLVRGIDETAYDLIEQAVTARQVSSVQRVTDLAVFEDAGPAARLTWTDESTGESGFLIHRLDQGSWDLVAELSSDATSWKDTQLEKGRSYRYTVQPLDALGNRLPKSPDAGIRIGGGDPEIADFLGHPWLTLNSTGDSNWFVNEADQLRAGKINSLGTTTLQMPIIGPGTLSFTWRASSEENVAYLQGSPNTNELYLDIYDAVFLHLDGAPVQGQEDDVFLSGITEAESRELIIPAGAHVVDFIYEKDPYTSEGDDTAFLESLQWTPSDTAPYPVLGGYAILEGDIHSSKWLGTYQATDSSWIGHYELGWLYRYQGDGYGLWLNIRKSGLGNLYTHPDLYPFMYSVEQEHWLYYFEGSGSAGENLRFYDFKDQKVIFISD